VDPRDGTWRYIGATTLGMKRAKSHAFPSSLRRSNNRHKANWIRSLPNGYDIEILEEFASPDPVFPAEAEWIAAARSLGVPLLNKTDGGEGATGVTYQRTDEWRHRQSITHKGRSLSKLHSLHISEALRGRRHSPLARQRMSEANKGRPSPLKGRPRSQETRSSISKALTGRKMNPAFREERCRINAEVANRPALREAQGQRARIFFDDPANRIHQARLKGGGRPFRDEAGEVYVTQGEAARALGVTQGEVSAVLSGKRKSARGHVLIYVEAPACST